MFLQTIRSSKIKTTSDLQVPDHLRVHDDLFEVVDLLLLVRCVDWTHQLFGPGSGLIGHLHLTLIHVEVLLKPGEAVLPVHRLELGRVKGARNYRTQVGSISGLVTYSILFC